MESKKIAEPDDSMVLFGIYPGSIVNFGNINGHRYHLKTWPDENGELFLLPGLLTAHLLGADVVVEGEEAVEEDHQPHQGRRQQPSRVESWNFEM